jgi:hypothetical protein
MSQRTMMVDLGEAQVFKRHVAKAIEGPVDVNGPCADLLKKPAELVLVHGFSLAGWEEFLDHRAWKIGFGASQ